LDQWAVVDKGVNRQQLKRGDTKLSEVTDDGRRRQSAKLSAPSRWYVLAQTRQAFDVRLIDDRILPRYARAVFLAPAERFVDHQRFGHAARVVAAIKREVRPQA